MHYDGFHDLHHRQRPFYPAGFAVYIELGTKGDLCVEVVARLIELKPSSEEKVQTWAEYINANRANALASLEAEGVSVESWFSLTLNGKQYLLCYMRSESMERAHHVAATSENPVDAVHQQFKVDTWVRGAGAVGELLVDLSAGRD
jgi:hypothetical protein